VDKSGYGKRKLKAGQAWGVAVHESFESVIAYVVASLKGKGRDRQAVLEEVHAGVHCNLP
jgi:isoquinoline 1-oxidoreductase beta subunit